jgi:hypothetical protein
MITVCTIVTGDYLAHAKALSLSLRRHRVVHRLAVLVVTRLRPDIQSTEIITLRELSDGNSKVRELADKYGNDSDALRWALKPAFILYLLGLHRDNILYADCDICFFGRPLALLAPLKNQGVVLTPHWRPPLPTKDLRSFRLNFLDGLYNAGCIGVGRRGVAAMAWWLDCCTSACEKDYNEGLYVDQRYLDLMPIYFPEVAVCRHRGYNLADWNRHLRHKPSNGRPLVPGRWKVRAVHFTRNTIARIEAGKDAALEPYYQEYVSILAQAKKGSWL